MAFDPSKFIPKIGRSYPWCYTRLDEVRRDSKVPTLDMMERLLIEAYGVEVVCAGAIAPTVCGCAAWNGFKRVYAFHEVLSGFLVAAADGIDLSAELPLDSLRYLPVPCLYVQAPNTVSDTVDGFFAWIEEGNEKDPLLRIVFVMGDGAFTPYSYVRLIPGAVLSDCLPDAVTLTEPVIRAAADGNNLACALLSGVPAVSGKLGNVIHNLTARALQLLLYLVSMDADIEEPKAPAGEEAPPIHVGKEAGERMRHIIAHKKAHIRQGHWHKYWVGPKNGERRLVAKWIEPVVVGEGYLKTSKVTVAAKDGI